MKTLTTIFSLFLAVEALGQDDETQDFLKEPAAEELKKLYESYVSEDFSRIASELARDGGESGGMFVCPSPEQAERPWEVGRYWTLVSAWNYHTDYSERKESPGKTDAEEHGENPQLWDEPAGEERRR